MVGSGLAYSSTSQNKTALLAYSPTSQNETALTREYAEIEQRQAKHGMRFAEAVPTAEAKISAEEAKAKALEAAASMLERPATAVDVKLVRFSFD